MRRFLTVMTVVLAGGLLTACGGDTPTAPVDVVLESADGKLTLDIPAGALPRGVAAADITISDVSDDPEFFVQSDGDTALAVVLLEPLGLEFSQPVTLTVRDLDIEPIEPPPETDPPIEIPSPIFVLHIFGDDAEVITDVVSEVDPQTNRLTASIPLMHFSWVIVTDVENLAGAEVVAPDAADFARPFDVTVKARRIVAPGQVVFEGTFTDSEGEETKYIRRMSDRPWELRGLATGSLGVGPKRIKNVPAPSTSVTGATFERDVEFECTSDVVGWKVDYYIIARFMLTSEVDGVQGRDQLWVDTDTGDAAGVCNIPKIFATAAPPKTGYFVLPGLVPAPSYVWSGWTCGSVGFTETSELLIWTHGGPTVDDCDHTEVGHPEATISLLVTGTFTISGGPFELRCTYPGALTGEGDPCTRIK